MNDEAALGQLDAFPRILSCFFLFRREFCKSLRILERGNSIPTAPTNFLYAAGHIEPCPPSLISGSLSASREPRRAEAASEGLRLPGRKRGGSVTLPGSFLAASNSDSSGEPSSST